MAKKKKTQLKPVARGFATTSVPKKVVETPPEAEKSVEVVQDSSLPTAAEISSSAQGSTQAQAQEADSATPETQALQNLVEKFQDRTEREIVRTVKVSGMFQSSNLITIDVSSSDPRSSNKRDGSLIHCPP